MLARAVLIGSSAAARSRGASARPTTIMRRSEWDHDSTSRPRADASRVAAVGSIAAAVFACGTAIAACGVAADAGAEGAPDPGDVPGPSGGDGSTGSGSGGGPPEEELEAAYGAPVATGKLVWVANPTSGRVAFIDAAALTVKVVEAGHAPTHLAPLPSDDGSDAAIVLNVLSADATVLRASGGSLSTQSLAVPSSGNRWSISADGRFATAWTDARFVEQPDPIDGFQDVTVLDLKPGAESSTPLTIGYRPVAIGYDAAATRAFAVTQDGIGVVVLDEGEPFVERNVKLSDDPLENAMARDVTITPDGAYALVRRDGQSAIAIFDLATGARTDVALPGPVTDLDLSADGEVAVAVVRDTGHVAFLPLPAIANDPTALELLKIDDAVVGSVALAPESSVAILFTNATPSPLLTIVDTAAIEPVARTIQLAAPVSAVFPTPDASHAVVIHGAIEGSSKYAGAVSLVPIAADLPPKIVGLEAPPVSIAIAPDGLHALVAASDPDEKTHRLLVAEMPSFAVDVHELASEPIAAGIVAGAKRGFVAQEHPDGRITFVHLESGEVRTLTGFELASQVVNGSGT